MKRGIILSLIVGIILTTLVCAQEEFSVRFHSFGKNATINLKDYLGESGYYLASQTKNVVVKIDQEKGLAFLSAKPGWEGSEVVFFRTNESLQQLEDEEEIAKFLPAVPEILHMRRIREGELVRLFEGTIDPSILELIKDIKREEIRILSKEIEGKMARIRINDEVDLKLEMGYVPTVSMDFSIGGKEESEEETPKEEKSLRLKISNTLIIIVLSCLAVIGFFIYRKYAAKEEIVRQEKEIEYAISKDVKRLSLQRLQRMQKKLEKAGTSDEFVRIVREFFSRYFGMPYDFEFSHLMRRVKDSDVSGHAKKDIKKFLDALERIVYYPSEEWAEVYGKGKIPKSELKRLIIKMKKIIRML